MVNLNEKLKSWARSVKRDGLTLWFAGKSPQTPWYAKALGALVVAYALSPIDLIPHFIPVLGYVDDVLLLPALIWLTIWARSEDRLAHCAVAQVKVSRSAQFVRTATGFEMFAG